MNTLFHFIRLAVHNLRRGGKRILVALLCINFGVMSLVAMLMLAKSIESAVMLEPAELLGGDMSVGRAAEDFLRPEDIEQLNSLQTSGLLSGYTQIAFRSTLMIHAPNSGEMHFIGSALGVEPHKYPLAGKLAIQQPENSPLAVLIQHAGDVVVTRDVAERYHLNLDERIILADPRTGIPVNATLRGIANDTPNHQGDKIYYSLETAQRLSGSRPAVNTIIANTTHAGALIERLESGGWSVDWSAGSRDKKTANMWVIGLRGAGILGLLVAGVGIANTMQVLLRRRQREIAIWKTLGYSAAHLRLIYTLEAGLLGLAGSLIGAGLGVLISTGLLEVFRRTSTLLYQWTFSPLPPSVGILAGTLTTIIFAYQAIVAASHARPSALLREEHCSAVPPAGFDHPGCQSAALVIILAGLFTALTSLVMGSLAAGIGVLAGILVGLAALGGIFHVLLWICTRILSLRRFPLAHMAISGLRRRRSPLVFAMIALFAGVITLSMGLIVVQMSERRIAAGPADVQGYNLNIIAEASQESTIRDAIAAQNTQNTAIGYRTALARINLAGSSEPITGMDLVLAGRSNPDDYMISGAAWDSQPVGVYAYEGANIAPGSQVQVTFHGGAENTYTVVGTYDINYRSGNLYPSTGLLLPATAFRQSARPDTVLFFVQVAPEQLDRATKDLVINLPQATVINLPAYAGRFMQSYRDLYLLPIVLAALAMLAGFLLIANAASLAVLDRRYEMGILKAIGYSRRQVLTIFTVEYGLAGLLATGMGVLVIEALLAVFAIANQMPAILLLLNPPSLALIAFCGVGLTLLIVLGITWAPASVPPLAILNDRNA